MTVVATGAGFARVFFRELLVVLLDRIHALDQIVKLVSGCR
jgi:hypothetical protein